MTEERLVQIEEKLAHQEHALGELNAVVTQQADSISRLERLCASLADRLRSVSERLPNADGAEEKPPHY